MLAAIFQHCSPFPCTSTPGPNPDSYWGQVSQKCPGKHEYISIVYRRINTNTHTHIDVCRMGGGYSDISTSGHSNIKTTSLQRTQFEVQNTSPYSANTS